MQHEQVCWSILHAVVQVLPHVHHRLQELKRTPPRKPLLKFCDLCSATVNLNADITSEGQDASPEAEVEGTSTDAAWLDDDNVAVKEDMDSSYLTCSGGSCCGGGSSS